MSKPDDRPRRSAIILRRDIICTIGICAILLASEIRQPPYVWWERLALIAAIPILCRIVSGYVENSEPQ